MVTGRDGTHVGITKSCPTALYLTRRSTGGGGGIPQHLESPSLEKEAGSRTKEMRSAVQPDGPPDPKIWGSTSPHSPPYLESALSHSHRAWPRMDHDMTCTLLTLFVPPHRQMLSRLGLPEHLCVQYPSRRVIRTTDSTPSHDSFLRHRKKRASTCRSGERGSRIR